MSTERFSTGKQFIWQGVTWEVKWLLPGSRLNVENSVTGEIRQVRFVDLLRALVDRQLQFLGVRGQPLERPRRSYVDLGDVPPKQREAAEYRLVVIQPLLKLSRRERPLALAVVQARVREVKAAQATGEMPQLPVSKSSIYEWIKMYRESGEDIRALIPNSHKQGGRDKARLQAETDAIITAVIEEQFFTRGVVTIDDIHHEVAVRIASENASRAASDKLTLLSRATVGRRIKALDRERKVTAKRGRAAARREFTQYGAMEYPQIPLERVEIDHTPTDVIIIDDEDNLPLGRLTFTFCLDAATRYPLGRYIGFEPPSYLTVMECLFHAIMPKGDVRERFGVEHEWLAHGVPYELAVDNGREFIGRDLTDACLALGITLQQLPVKTPEFKAAVERIFGTVNTGLFHKLPGTTFSSLARRGDYDSLKYASLTLDELDRLLHIFLLDVYAESFHRGLQGIPARRWAEATRDGFFPRVPADPDDLLITLGRVTYRTIQRYGIEFESLRYNAPELAQLRARMQDEAGRLRDNWSERKGREVKIKYHPGDISRLYVYDPFAREYIEVPALARQYTEGLSLWKHRVIRRQVLEEQERVDIEALGQAKRKIQKIVAESKQRKKKRTRAKIGRWQMGGTGTTSRQTGKNGDGFGNGRIADNGDKQPALPPLDLPDVDLDGAEDAGWGVNHELPIEKRGEYREDNDPR